MLNSRLIKLSSQIEEASNCNKLALVKCLLMWEQYNVKTDEVRLP